MFEIWNGNIDELKNLNHADKIIFYRNIADRILKQNYGYEISFPIDIRKVIKSIKIDIAEKNLNVDCGFTPDKVYVFKDNSINRTIYVEYKLSERVKRYLLAYGLSCYILDDIDSKEEKIVREYSDPLFLKSMKYIDADYLASYLLFPLKTTLDFMEDYIDELKERNVYPLDTKEWIRRLAQEAQVDYKDTISCYYKVRELATHLYNSKKNEDIKKYTNLFR